MAEIHPNRLVTGASAVRKRLAHTILRAIRPAGNGARRGWLAPRNGGYTPKGETHPNPTPPPGSGGVR